MFNLKSLAFGVTYLLTGMVCIWSVYILSTGGSKDYYIASLSLLFMATFLIFILGNALLEFISVNHAHSIVACVVSLLIIVSGFVIPKSYIKAETISTMEFLVKNYKIEKAKLANNEFNSYSSITEEKENKYLDHIKAYLAKVDITQKNDFALYLETRELETDALLSMLILQTHLDGYAYSIYANMDKQFGSKIYSVKYDNLQWSEKDYEPLQLSQWYVDNKHKMDTVGILMSIYFCIFLLYLAFEIKNSKSKRLKAT